MRTLFTTISILFISLSISAQDIETYYYSKDGKNVNQVFADYYRVISVPSDTNPDKLFRDFYMSGKIKGEGHYISIDQSNANNSILDGECVFYREDGAIEKKFYMINGKLDGTYIQFSPDGREFKQIEYNNGEYAYDWYYRANNIGAYGRFKHTSHEPVYDDFNPEAQFTTWIDGIPWLSYTINGLTISMAIQQSDQYGKYHEVSLILDNTTFFDMVIEPNIDISARGALSDNRLVLYGESREVLSYDTYMQKVQNRQAWATIAMAVSSAASSVSNALSSNSVSVSINGHTAFINSYGNNISIYSPNLAFAGVGETWASDRKIIQKGYFKKNTITSGSIVSGYFNIKREEEKYLEVTYNYNGVEIPFYWDVSEATAKPLAYESLQPKLKKASNTPFKEHIYNDYKWQAKHTSKVESIKVKKNTKIRIADWSRIFKGQNFIVVDANGEHKISDISTGSVETVLTLDIVDLQFPFSILCQDNEDLNILNIEMIN